MIRRAKESMMTRIFKMRSVIRRSGIGLLTLLLTTGVQAQQDPQYTMYFWNTQALNPGYAGTLDVLSITGLSRHQWTGLDGAPTTQTLAIHSPLANDAIGVGFSVVHDEVGPVSTNLIYADIAYKIKTTENAKLSFGLKAGVNLFSADLGSLDNVDANDPLFQSNISSNLTPNFGFGAYYYSKKGYVGVSAPKLLENEQGEAERGTEVVSTILERRHYFVTAGYVFDLSETVKLRPATIIKAVSGAPLSVDLSANFFFMDRLSVGAAYRIDDSVAGVLGYQITDQFRAGYAHDFTLSELSDQHSGTHEFMLSYDLRVNRDRTLSPRYF